MAKLHIKKGDTVLVLAGDDKKSKGKVLEVIVKKNRAIVEGLNLVSKHQKPSAAHPQGGIVKMEASIHLSNLQVIDSKGTPTKIGRKLEDGKIVRYSKKTGGIIK